MPDQRDPSKVGLTVYVDRDLRTAANERAKERGETLTAAIDKFLRRYVK